MPKRSTKHGFKFEKPAPPGIDSHRDPNDAFTTKGPIMKAKGKTDHPIGSIARKATANKKAGHRKPRNKGKH